MSEQVRVLDAIAAALAEARQSQAPQRVIDSLELNDQFDVQIGPKRWGMVGKLLDCPLPPLEFNQGHWLLPIGLRTITDLASLVTRRHPHLKPTEQITHSSWRDAQIFVRVQNVLVDCCNLDPQRVHRSSRLIEDLEMS